VSRIIIETLEGLGLEFPTLDASHKRELARVRRALESER
jgi:hypothetical protein